jgi:hypothetical protein
MGRVLARPVPDVDRRRAHAHATRGSLAVESVDNGAKARAARRGRRRTARAN